METEFDSLNDSEKELTLAFHSPYLPESSRNNCYEEWPQVTILKNEEALWALRYFYSWEENKDNLDDEDMLKLQQINPLTVELFYAHNCDDFFAPFLHWSNYSTAKYTNK